jgi:medium-chain acyl-[acyl-carrier-protein] hydrolase
MAILHSEKAGYTLDYYEKANQGFMILKWDINIYRHPVFNESIKIVTRPYSFKKFLANRSFKVYSADGDLIADGDTVWVFADTITRRPLRVPEELHLAFGVGPEGESLFKNLEDIEPLRDGEIKTKINVRNTDIDTNFHVNNVRYIEWAIRSLPEEFTSQNSAVKINVSYKKELQNGDEGELITEITENGDGFVSRHSIFSSEKEICHVRFKWKKG